MLGFLRLKMLCSLTLLVLRTLSWRERRVVLCPMFNDCVWGGEIGVIGNRCCGIATTLWFSALGPDAESDRTAIAFLASLVWLPVFLSLWWRCNDGHQQARLLPLAASV